MIEILLRRAWDALDAFKQAYPENWHEEDQQVLDDLVKADLRLSGAEMKWQGLTDEEVREFEIWLDGEEEKHGWNPPADIVKYLEAKLKEKNHAI